MNRTAAELLNDLMLIYPHMAPVIELVIKKHNTVIEKLQNKLSEKEILLDTLRKEVDSIKTEVNNIKSSSLREVEVLIEQQRLIADIKTYKQI